MTTYKTKSQIIDETAQAYTSTTRAVNPSGTCAYLTYDGKCCAIGRCMINPRHRNEADMWAAAIGEEDWLSEDYSKGLSSKLESLLKPEYRGHEEAFWEDIQLLHDYSQNWTTTGLSHLGNRQVARLHQCWDNMPGIQGEV